MFPLGELESAARVVGVPRLLIAWEEPDEPWLFLTWWDRGELHCVQEPPGSTEPLVPEKLAESSFLCTDVKTTHPLVFYRSPDGLKHWSGLPLHPTLQARFAATSILSARLTSDLRPGRVFFLDKQGLIPDDLTLAEAAARLLTMYLLRRQSADKTILEERLRLARDLHDGALHSLAGVAIELENLVRGAELDQPNVRRRVLEIHKSLLEEQRNIRRFIAELRAGVGSRSVADTSLADRIDELVCRMQRRWNLSVDCVLGGLESVSSSHSTEIYRLVGEALTNAARHGGANRARIEIVVVNDDVTIMVTDNGRGLDFKGRYELPALAQLHLGPLTLRERVAALGGTLAIDSSESGTRLEIMLPLKHPIPEC